MLVKVVHVYGAVVIAAAATCDLMIRFSSL